MGRKQTEQTKERIRKALSKEPEKKICPQCKNEFETKRHSIYCSRLCAAKQPKKKGENRKKGSGGLRNGGGKSKQIPYVNWIGHKMFLNKEEIKVAKILDQNKLIWKRNTKGFSYVTEDGKNRKFYPDFIVDDKKFIEYKGWITSEMKWKMQNAKKQNNLDLTIIVGEDERYKNFGISLKEFNELLVR